jgi:hypothetical protein
LTPPNSIIIGTIRITHRRTTPANPDFLPWQWSRVQRAPAPSLSNIVIVMSALQRMTGFVIIFFSPNRPTTNESVETPDSKQNTCQNSN